MPGAAKIGSRIGRPLLPGETPTRTRRRHPTAYTPPTPAEQRALEAELAGAETPPPGESGPGKPGRPGRPFDVAFHVSGEAKAPPWTPQREDAFLQAYWDTKGDFRKTCHRLRIPYRAAVAHRTAAAGFRERLELVDQMYADQVETEFKRRALEDEKHPAYGIFFLKKNIPKYADAADKKAPVQVAVLIGDSALGRGPAALTEGVSVVEAGG